MSPYRAKYWYIHIYLPNWSRTKKNDCLEISGLTYIQPPIDVRLAVWSIDYVLKLEISQTKDVENIYMAERNHHCYTNCPCCICSIKNTKLIVSTNPLLPLAVFFKVLPSLKLRVRPMKINGWKMKPVLLGPGPLFGGFGRVLFL